MFINISSNDCTERASTLNAIYSTTFNQKEVTTTINADYTHRGLFAARQGFEAQITNEPKICAKTNKETITSANLLTAGVGILYSDTPEPEGALDTLLFQSWPIPEPTILETPVIWNVQSFFIKEANSHHSKIAANKSLRNTDFQTMLNRHIQLYDIHAEAVEKPKHNSAVASYESPQYHEIFHHSEQSLLAYLYRKDKGQLFLKNTLKELKPAYVAGIILDLYSDRPVCANCAVGLSGCQCSQDENGFLFETSTLLNTLQVGHPEKLFLSTRVSAESKSQEAAIAAPPEAASFLKINPANNPSFVFEQLGQTYQKDTLKQEPLFKNPSIHFSSRQFKAPAKMQNIVKQWTPPTTFKI